MISSACLLGPDASEKEIVTLEALPNSSNNHVSLFAFPTGLIRQPKQIKERFQSFALTQGDGMYLFGHCCVIHYKKNDSDSPAAAYYMPSCLCVMSKRNEHKTLRACLKAFYERVPVAELSAGFTKEHLSMTEGTPRQGQNSPIKPLMDMFKSEENGGSEKKIKKSQAL